MSEINDFKVDRIQWRISLLATTCLSISLLTVYSWFSPTAGKREVKSFTFPDRILLNSWQLVKTESLPLNNLKPLHEGDGNPSRLSDRITSTKHYSYLKNGIPFDIEMRYVIGTRGDIVELIKQRTIIPKEAIENAEIEKIPEVGYYALLSNRDRAYLSTCINSRGNTTVTAQQFSHNRYTQDFKYNRVLPWLQGKDSLRDSRCLWVQISTPITKSTSPTAYQNLTKAWIDWYHWWQPRFPKL
jgi:cyanosortase A-associated protein